MENSAPKKPQTGVLISLYDYHSKLYNNVLADISDADAGNRLGTKANHVAWLAGSLVNERFTLAGMLGVKEKQTADELFENHKGIQDEADYPSLAEYKSDWEKVTPLLKEAMEKLTEEQLNGPDPYEMPGGDYTLFDSLTFCTDRESYVIGQIALYRRLLGYEAMKYE